MVAKLFDNLRVVFASAAQRTDSNIETFAKIEYGKDWRYAVRYMRNNGGNWPQIGVKW